MSDRVSQHFECSCNIPEHMLVFSYYKDSKSKTEQEVYVNEEDIQQLIRLICWSNYNKNVQLYTYQNIFKRIWAAIKYIFNSKRYYSQWDTTILNDIQVRKMALYLLNALQEWHLAEKEDINKLKEI